jgi:hypothetical protein
MTDGRRRIALALAAALAVGALAPAAQAGTPEDETKSRQLFKQADGLANEGKWKEACLLFQAAHELNSTGGTAIRAADCYEKIGEYERALGMYQYIVDHRATDKVPERVKIAEGRIVALKKQLAPDAPPPPPSAGKTPPAGPTAQQTPVQGLPKPPPPPPPKPNRVPAIVMFAVGGAGAVVGGVMGGLALKQAGDVKTMCGNSAPPNCGATDPHVRADAKSAASAATTKAWVANVGIGLAVAGVATGAVLWALGVPKAAEKVKSAVGPGGVTIRF